MFAIEIIIKDSLYAVNYGATNEFRRLFTLWQNPEYLEDFFETHKSDLQSEFFGNITIEDAIKKTIDEAYEFEQLVLTIAETGNICVEECLETYFKSLYNHDKYTYPIPVYEKRKAYGPGTKSWLRLYAIRIDDNVFIITGGGIKLTRTMNEREHLQEELQKMEQVKKLLISEGIIDNDSLINYIELQF